MTQSESAPPVRLLVLYDASVDHDDAYFRNLRRLVRVNYAKSTRVHAYIAQSTDNNPRCPSKFRRKVLCAIGSRLLINYHLKSMPHDNFNQEGATQRSISKDDECSVIIFDNLLH
jgi:hypothetical protein